MPFRKILWSQDLVAARVPWKTVFTDFFFPVSFPCPPAESCHHRRETESLIVPALWTQRIVQMPLPSPLCTRCYLCAQTHWRGQSLHIHSTFISPERFGFTLGGQHGVTRQEKEWHGCLIKWPQATVNRGNSGLPTHRLPGLRAEEEPTSFLRTGWEGDTKGSELPAAQRSRASVNPAP